MEVHHHPEVEKKGFKEYLLEGLMIFLAVTMGFFAESLREHIKDESVVHSDVESMVADLRSDVALYNATLASDQLSDRRIDTLITLLKTDRSNTAEIYFLARSITANNITYTPGGKAFEQMKSTGSLKLIRPRKLLDSISDYYQSLLFFPGTNNLQSQKLTDVHLVNSRLFDGYTFHQMLRVAAGAGFGVRTVNKPVGNPPLLSNNSGDINAVILAYHYLYAVTEVNNKAAVARRENAIRLVKLLTKEFDLQ